MQRKRARFSSHYTYRFFDSTKLLKLLAESGFLGVPCQATLQMLAEKEKAECWVRRALALAQAQAQAATSGLTYPIKSFDMTGSWVPLGLVSATRV